MLFTRIWFQSPRAFQPSHIFQINNNHTFTRAIPQHITPLTVTVDNSDFSTDILVTCPYFTRRFFATSKNGTCFTIGPSVASCSKFTSGHVFSGIRVAEDSALCIALGVPHIEIGGVHADCRMVIVCGIGCCPQFHHQEPLFARTA